IQLIRDLHFEPAWRRDAPRAARRLEASTVIVPEGSFVVGTEDRAVAYDNERPAHVVELGRFRIDAAPVSNAQFLDCLPDGGYRRRELWSEDGWRWLEAARVEHPLFWERGAGGWWLERRFGRRGRLELRRPVVHVSWYEADAFARWAGKRLP